MINNRFDKDKTLLNAVVIANPRGFGFLNIGDEKKNLRLSRQQMKLLFHNEVIRVRTINHRVEIVGFIKRIKYIIGRIILIDNQFYLQAIDNKIIPKLIIQSFKKPYKVNQIVLTKIVRYPDEYGITTVKIIKKISQNINLNAVVASTLLMYDVKDSFNKAVVNDIKQLPKTVSKTDLSKRIDLCHLPFITIDGDDAKDFDDAVYVKKNNNVWRLLVAIADVANYVTSNSVLDKSAKQRGTSIYFANQVVPMLPFELSNELCSLKPNVKRLSVVCDVDLDASGNIIKYQFYEAVICSHKRLTYHQVNDLIINDNATCIQDDIANVIFQAYDLFTLLTKVRQKQGALLLNSTLEEMVFNQKNEIVSMGYQKNTVANKIIECFMVFANHLAAKFLHQYQSPALYRIHTKPSLKKVEQLMDTLRLLNVHVKQYNHLSNQVLNDIIVNNNHRKDIVVIQSLILRSLQQAVYSCKHKGHFGLGLSHYVHFTSPIRRYPDLFNQRMIKYIIHKQKKKHIQFDLKVLASHTTKKEQEADTIGRIINQYLKCTLAKKYIGKVYDGVVSGFNSDSIFILIDDLAIDGTMVANYKNNFILNEHHTSLYDSFYKKKYQLGDSVLVAIQSVDLFNRKIIVSDQYTKN